MGTLIENLQAELQAKTRVQTEKETASQTASQTEVQTIGETAKTAEKQRKTVEIQAFKQGSKNAQTREEKISKKDSNNFEKASETEEAENPEYDPVWEEMLKDPEEGEEDDPLLDMVEEQETTTIEDEIEEGIGDSTKNLDTLEDLGELLMNYLDNSKAQLCGAISGQSAALYASDKRAKKALIKATKNYIQQIGVKTPSPTQTFLIAVGIWLLPSLSLAGYQRFKMVRERKYKLGSKPVVPTTESSLSHEDKEEETIGEYSGDEQEEVDYTQTKEYQEKRRLFDRHAKGTYRHLVDGTYANVDLADEFPSTEILALLEEGHSNASIRSILYGE